MSSRKGIALILGIVGLVSGCATTQISISKAQKTFQVNTIALMPGGGVLADSVGTSLLQYNFGVMDTTTVSSLMYRDNLNEAEIMLPVNLKKLKDQGIDTVLNVRTVAGYDGKPQSASFRLVSTEDGMIICGGSWNNAKNGAQGSIADAAARRDITVAANEIAAGIAQVLGRVNAK
jgi:hypothetical protein